MNIKPRMAALLLFASTVHLPGAHAQTSSPAVTEGLWEAKNRFGPDVQGPLAIVQDVNGWRAEIAGVRAQVQVSGDTVSFTLPNKGGSLIAYLAKDRSTISGHWIQPPIVSSATAECGKGNEFWTHRT
jgi:hypothetical protein